MTVHPLSSPHPTETSRAQERVVTWAGRLLLALFLALYLATLDTGLQPYELQGGDLITHQYAQVQARPSNAPGYPLYTMGGWLWFHGIRGLLRLLGDPLPNPIPILSSYSTLWALLALGLLYRILCRLTRSREWPAGNWPLAFLLAGFYGLTYFFWYYATTTEQYSSAVAQTLALVYVYLLWREAGDRDPRRARRLLYLLAFLAGLSLAHMVTVALIVPPLVAVILWERPALLRRPRLILGSFFWAGLPLLSYAYVYLRGASHPEWWGEGAWSTPREWFWSFLLTRQGQEELSWGLEAGRSLFTDIFPALIVQELSLPLLILGLAGIALLGKRLDVLLYATLLLYFLLSWVDRFGNWFQVIMPAYPLILLGVAPLAQRLQAWLKERGGPRLATGLPLLLLILAVAWRWDASWPRTDSRNRPEDTALVRPALLLDQPLPPGAGLFAEAQDALGLDYLIRIWGIRPDLTVVSSVQARAFLTQGRPLLATWQATPLLQAELSPSLATLPLAETPDWVHLFPASGQSPASHLREGPSSHPEHEPARYLGQALGEGILLAGYAVRPGPQGQPVISEPQPATDVLLYWRASPDATPQDWAISVRPLRRGAPVTGPDGQLLQQDSPGPVHGLLPFSRLPGQGIISDAYRLPLPQGAMDGLLVILYRATDQGFVHLAELTLPLAE